MGERAPEREEALVAYLDDCTKKRLITRELVLLFI
jgi:hypothetical protein